jgi:hypothetical protein
LYVKDNSYWTIVCYREWWSVSSLDIVFLLGIVGHRLSYCLFFFWPLYCLFFDIWLLIPSLVCSNFLMLFFKLLHCIFISVRERARNCGFRMKCGGWKVYIWGWSHDDSRPECNITIIVLMERPCFNLQYDVSKICQELA